MVWPLPPGSGRPRGPAKLRAWGLVAAVLAVSSCDPASTEARLGPRDDQLTQPYFPTGIAVLPDGDTLAVISSNFDERFDSGAVMLADLRVVDERLAGLSPDAAASAAGWVTDAYYETVYVQAFGNRPVVSPDGTRLLLTTRGGNRLNEIEIEADAAPDGGDAPRPLLSCNAEPKAEGEPVTCGQGGHTLEMPINDPYDVLITDIDSDDVRGVVSYLSGSSFTFFRVRTTRDGENRMQIRDELELGEEVFRVRGAALFPRGGGRLPLVIAAVERDGPLAGQVALDLQWFDPEDQRDAVIRRRDIYEDLGVGSARSIVATPSGDAVIVLLREPDGLARYEVQRTGSTIALTPGGVGETCDNPTDIEVVELELDDGRVVERVLVACTADHTVAVYHPLTLAQTDVARFFGDGPFDIALRRNHNPPQALVSFFLDDTIGVFDLIDGEGEPRLIPRGRLGVRRPQPQDGR